MRADPLNMGNPIGRAIALALGMFTLLNVRGAENLWWIDIRPLPQAILALPGALLVFHALRPQLARPLVRATVYVLLGVLLLNSARFWILPLHGAPAIPLTVAVAGLLALVLRSPRLSRPRLAMATTLAVLALGLPLAQAASFGRTDYRRPADAIVVFGARAYADGTPSDALADRVRTACALYHEGHAPQVLMSGGPGDGAIHETEAMRTMAIGLGVPASAIELDADGLDTASTVAHSGRRTVLAVSHFWHLPRVKMAYRRAGISAYTVPAHERYIIRQTPYLMLREAAAFWWYWVRR